uniref:Uncharacterized protein n=1 Tax=viral metagenome TaxID=1070528 RepID=A0A6C0E8S3_9ZZZZ
MSNRDARDVTVKENDVEFYVKQNSIPLDQIRTILKHRKMSDDEADAFVEKIRETRHRVQKYSQKFIKKVDEHYGSHDITKIVEKATKFADKHKLSTLERDSIIKLAVSGDTNSLYNPIVEVKYTDMAKFMGIESPAGQVLNIGTKDYAPLNEIVKLYEVSKVLHGDIKLQAAMHRDCAPEILMGKFNSEKHNVSTHIHPVLVALFMPKITCVDKRMLYANMGRLVIQRALPFIDRNISLYDNVINGELEAEWELTTDIVRDPNSLAYFSNDTPITNILKRFRIQIELWKNVQSLRQGKFYASTYDDTSGINGFLSILSQYEWSYFDSPDMFHVQDEGTVLRKLLAVFSVRPTLVQLTSLNAKSVLGQVNYFNGLARTTFMNIPIINVRLPSELDGVPAGAISLRNAMSQADVVYEHKSIVPKNKTVIFTNGLLFFYINRRYQQLNLASLNVNYRYSSVPNVQWNIGQSAVNETEVDFDERMTVREDSLDLRSVVCVYKPPIDGHISIGCTTIVCQQGDAGKKYWYYRPMLANFAKLEPSGTWKADPPISHLQEMPSLTDPQLLSFNVEARKFGSVFVYAT